MKNARRWLATIGLLSVGLLVLTGCGDDFYSTSIRFRVRTDPIILEKVDLDEVARYDADPPDVLPLVSLGQLENPHNPYHAMRDKIKIFDPRSLSPEDRAAIQDELESVFGTPREPEIYIDVNPKGVKDRDVKKALPGVRKALGKLKLDPDTLEEGSRLYRLECLTCHGLEGDGRGPTATWVNPHPRDYRLGKFKFTSTDQREGTELKPLRADLLRTLEQGIEGTSMPSFNQRAPEELEALVSYVIFLSLRGETEYKTLVAGVDPETGKTFSLDNLRKKTQNPKATIKSYLNERAVLILAGKGFGWADSQAHPIKPAPYPTKYLSDEKELMESVKRGYKLFMTEDKGNCKSCHEDFGRRAKFKADEWGTVTRAANLTHNVYRGGRRPVDIYYRLHSGINGSGMPAARGLDEGDDTWDVVNFVRMLPYPAMRSKFEIPVP